MPIQDTSDIKSRIVNEIRVRGPCLPVHIAKGVNLNILFTSAFLSELLSEKEIKTSHMRVGSSPIYYLSGQESRLTNFSQYLKSKEKEAYELIKEKKFLKDNEQEPAIRVALRAIKDFAIPFTKNNENIWRFFIIPESELQETKQEIAEEIKEEPETTVEKENTKEIEEEKQEDKKIEIFDDSESEEIQENAKEKVEEKKEKEIKIKKPKPKKIAKKKTTSSKKDDKFFNIVKEFLSGKSIEILDIKGFNKNDLTLRIKINSEEKLLIAYNKKRITEKEIIESNKKASESNLKYIILSLGEPAKKITSLIEAIQNLSGIEKLE